MSELHDIERRVAVLEQIARDTATTLADIRGELRQNRTEMHGDLAGLRTDIQGLRSDIQQQGKELRGDFRWLLRFTIGGFVGMFALLAHGLHWF